VNCGVDTRKGGPALWTGWCIRRCGALCTILTHYGAPVAAVISIEEYQLLKHARGDTDTDDLPPEIQAQVEECDRVAASAIRR
jgi:hypothetical protein